MKRSEMVNLIANKLLEDHYTEEHRTHDATVFCLEKASELLYALEDAGIKPPMFKNFHPTYLERMHSIEDDWVFEGTDGDGHQIWSLKTEEWEPEDEKK